MMLVQAVGQRTLPLNVLQSIKISFSVYIISVRLQKRCSQDQRQGPSLDSGNSLCLDIKELNI